MIDLCIQSRFRRSVTVPGKVEGTLIGLCDQDPGQAQTGGLPGAWPVPVDAANLAAAQGQGVHHHRVYHHGEVQAVRGYQQEPRTTLYRQ